MRRVVDVVEVIDWAVRRQGVFGACEAGGRWTPAVAELAARGYAVAELVRLRYPVHPDAWIVAHALCGLDDWTRHLVRTAGGEPPWWCPEGVGRFVPVRRAGGEIVHVWSTSGKRRPVACEVAFVGAEPRLVEGVRRDYATWHAGVAAVAQRLAGDLAGLLAAHVVTGPRAAAAPWTSRRAA